MKGKSVTIQMADGKVVRATVLHGSGDNFNVKAENGSIYEIDRNIRNHDGAYVVIG